MPRSVVPERSDEASQHRPPGAGAVNSLARIVVEGELQRSNVAKCDTLGCLGQMWIRVCGISYCVICRPPPPPLRMYACPCGFFETAENPPTCPNGKGHAAKPCADPRTWRHTNQEYAPSESPLGEKQL